MTEIARKGGLCGLEGSELIGRTVTLQVRGQLDGYVLTEVLARGADGQLPRGYHIVRLHLDQGQSGGV